MVLTCITAATSLGRADPLPSSPAPANYTIDVFLGMVLLNFPLNLFWFSLMFSLAIQTNGLKAVRFRPGRALFHLKTVAAVLVITLIGVVIDLTLLYDNYNGWLTFAPESHNWPAASFLVGLSVLICSLLIIRLRFIYSVTLATGMALMNLVWWYFYENQTGNWLFLLYVCSIILVPVVLYSLDRWYRIVFVGKIQQTSNAALNTN
jgi:hypothetical protein